MACIGNDEDRAPGRESNLLRARPGKLRIPAIRVELTKDRQVGVTGVKCRIGLGTCWNLAPFGRHSADAGHVRTQPARYSPASRARWRHSAKNGWSKAG